MPLADPRYRSCHAKALFRAYRTVPEFFCRQCIADLTQKDLAVIQRNGLPDFKFKHPGAVFQHRNIQHSTAFDFDRDIHFPGFIPVCVAQVVRKRQHGFADKVGGKHFCFPNTVFCQFFAADTGHDPQFAVKTIAEPAK